MNAHPTPYDVTKRRWTFHWTPFRVFLAVVLVVGIMLIAYRLMFGLGAPTNLTDRWPWALWTWWKLTGVALAGAGYSTALMVHFLGKKRWHDIERGAFVVSLLGYLMVCSALILDLGQWYNAWHPLYSWGVHSVMFELYYCISAYTVVQVVEFLYIFEERLPSALLHKVLKKVYAPLLILGAILPVFHQSALCELYVIAKGREDPLWWSMLLPVFAVLTSFYIGSSIVTMENFVAEKTYGRPVHMRILGEMVRLSGGVMFVYMVLKIGDYWVRGVLPELFVGSVLGNIALVELGLGVVLPMLMFMTPSIRSSRQGIVTASAFAVAGVVLNRFNIVITGMMASTGAGFYKPSLMEVGFVFGLAAAVALAYLFIVENFPIYTEQDVAVAAARRAEEEARKRAKVALIEARRRVLVRR